jgi:hypothetical protein
MAGAVTAPAHPQARVEPAEAPPYTMSCEPLPSALTAPVGECE